MSRPGVDMAEHGTGMAFGMFVKFCYDLKIDHDKCSMPVIL